MNAGEYLHQVDVEVDGLLAHSHIVGHDVRHKGLFWPGWVCLLLQNNKSPHLRQGKLWSSKPGFFFSIFETASRWQCSFKKRNASFGISFDCTQCCNWWLQKCPHMTLLEVTAVLFLSLHRKKLLCCASFCGAMPTACVVNIYKPIHTLCTCDVRWF